MDKAPTTNGIAILKAIARGNHDRADIARKAGFTVPQVNGSLRTLASNGLITIGDDGLINTTSDAAQYTGAGKTKVPAKAAGRTAGEGASALFARPGSKKAKAVKLFDRFIERGRGVVLQKFQDMAGLTEKGAATYFQTIQRGMSGGVAAQKKAAGAKAAGKAVKAKAKKVAAKPIK